VAVLAQGGRLQRGEILIEKKSHEVRTISLLAKLAAYCRAAVMCSLVNCG
jgi:hypothetical protein